MIAYQGIPGAYGHQAALALDASAPLLALERFAQVLDAVASGQVSSGVVPIENVLHGSVIEVMDELALRAGCHVHRQINLPIEHCLAGVAGSDVTDVSVCLSHPQALAQCSPFIDKLDFTPRAALNTAIAARDVARLADPAVAAICSEQAASIYGLDVLARSLTSGPTNVTRFWQIATNPPDHAASRASFIFTAANIPGSLARCLEVFAELGLNLTQLESRPDSGEWQYQFWADCQITGDGLIDQGLIDQLAARLEGRAASLRVLGIYDQIDPAGG